MYAELSERAGVVGFELFVGGFYFGLLCWVMDERSAGGKCRICGQGLTDFLPSMI